MFKPINMGRPNSMYPDEVLAPMRADLTDIGFTELKTVEEVETFFAESSEPALVVVNSVCGCSAGAARPAVKLALKNDKKPTRLVTVFAGQDMGATAKMREFLVGIQASSPMFALFVDNKPVFTVERHQIEGRYLEDIAEDLTDAFDRLL